MSDCVSFLVELGVKPGQADSFKSLVSDMVQSVKASEPGTLVYEYFLDGNGSTCHIYERYTDSAAALQHLGALQEKYLDRLMAVSDVNRLVVYGSANAELQGVLSGLGASFLPQLDGFAR